MNWIINLLLHLKMTFRRFVLWPAFLRKLQIPDAVQHNVLISILRRNQHTRFGKEHDFAAITTPREYAARVPLQNYEDLRPYIEREQQGEPRQLTDEPPILFALTSGTTGKPKYIPILARSVAQAKFNQRLFSSCLYAAIPGIFRGKSLGFVSPAVEGKLPSGLPYGSMSGLIYRSMPWLLRRKYAVPAVVFEIQDYELKYFLIAAFALAERSISYIGAANPSTLLKLAELIRTRRTALLAAIETGELAGLERLDSTAGREIQRAFRVDPSRADELRALLNTEPQGLFSRLWPGLKAVSCWREGSCRLLLPAVQQWLGAGVAVLELGYLASEARGSLPVDPRRHREVPALHESYFEFIDRTDWEMGRQSIKIMGELQVGHSYYVILTTSAGLYRYFMNDIITVDGRYEQTPTIKFLEKGAGATNITGEKLYESQVTAAVEAALSGAASAAAFFVMVADEMNQQYQLYIEDSSIVPTSFLATFETELAARNLEYKAKRSSGRLRSTDLKILHAGTGEAYKAHFIAQGQREAQFKFVRLQTRARLTFDLDAHCVDPTP